MKPQTTVYRQAIIHPAAFRRLCVETVIRGAPSIITNPAAFRRLCVETFFVLNTKFDIFPAAFRRLCVETPRSMAGKQG